MKKVFTVSVVLIMFLLLFTAQNSLAQNDPFEIGKEIAMTGEFRPNTWGKFIGDFSVFYDTELNTVEFQEIPESGNGTWVMWIKQFGPNTYSKFTCAVENGEIKKETEQMVSITKEKAEQEAWKILGYLGYSK